MLVTHLYHCLWSGSSKFTWIGGRALDLFINFASSHNKCTRSSCLPCSGIPFQAGALWLGCPFAEQNQVGLADKICSPHPTQGYLWHLCVLTHSCWSQQVSEPVLTLMYPPHSTSSSQVPILLENSLKTEGSQFSTGTSHEWARTLKHRARLSIFQNYTMHSYTSSKQLFLLGTPHKWPGVHILGLGTWVCLVKANDLL